MAVFKLMGADKAAPGEPARVALAEAIEASQNAIKAADDARAAVARGKASVTQARLRCDEVATGVEDDQIACLEEN